MSGLMSKGVNASERLEIQIGEGEPLPLYEQLAGQLRSWISSGAVSAGGRIPSVRQLSRYTKVGIVTVRHAIDMLVEEGLLTKRQGSGTYVSDTVAGRPFFWRGNESPAESPAPAPPAPEGQSVRLLDFRPAHSVFRQFSEVGDEDGYSDSAALLPVDFRVGAPPAESCADAQWLELMTRLSREVVSQSIEIEDPQGLLPLREHIARWLNRHRGLDISGDDVMLVSGAQQARLLITRLFVERGTRVGLEEPGSIFARKTFRSYGAEIVPVAVDDSGLIMEELERAGKLGLLYTCPSAQFPTGAVLSSQRRKRIADWADRTNSLIVEDDSYSELSYESRPSVAIYSLNPERTFYFGTFSQLRLHSWRLGYLVVPPQLRNTVSDLKTVTGGGGSALVQHLALSLFETGYFYRQLKKVMRSCMQKRDMLVRQLRAASLSDCRITPVKGGIHQTIWLPPAVDDVELVAACYAAGVELLPLSPHCLVAPRSSGLIFNFSAATLNQIEQGVGHVRRALEGQSGA